MSVPTPIAERIAELGSRAVAASRRLAIAETDAKNAALNAVAEGLDAGREALAAANELDLAAARDAGLSSAMIDRLTLTPARIDAMIEGVRQIAAMPDPVGRELSSSTHRLGMKIVKRSVPIGVIAMIYESRPNVTIDAAALCVKAGNAVILRGGREAAHSNAALADIFRAAIMEHLPEDAVQFVDNPDRAGVTHLVQAVGVVDLVIPRGGEGLIRAVTEQARIPVIKHYKGVCHVYVDRDANLAEALEIVDNAKCQRPGVCNALETLLVHQDVADELLPALAARLEGVELRGDERTREVIDANEASEDDWHAEYLDLILAVRVVDSFDDAIDHIATYGSRHTEAIVSENADAQQRFVRAVDAAAVMVNASTRFMDGSEFGMGAEIGISTDKLHARGPMGLNELTSYKYEVWGEGQTRP